VNIIQLKKLSTARQHPTGAAAQHPAKEAVTYITVLPRDQYVSRLSRAEPYEDRLPASLLFTITNSALVFNHTLSLSSLHNLNLLDISALYTICKFSADSARSL
jgi:hypothetical protein